MADVLLSKALLLVPTDPRLGFIRGVLGLSFDAPLDFSHATVVQLERIEDALYRGEKEWVRLADLYEIETRDMEKICKISLKRKLESLTWAVLADGFCKHRALRWAVHYQRYRIVEQLLADESFEILPDGQRAFLGAMSVGDTTALKLFLDCPRFDVHYKDDAFLKRGINKGWYEGVSYVTDQLGGTKRKREEQKFKPGDIVEAVMEGICDYVGTIYLAEVLEFDHKKQKYKCELLTGPRFREYWPEEQLSWPRGTGPERQWKVGDRVDYKLGSFEWAVGTVTKTDGSISCEVKFDDGELGKVFVDLLRMH